MGSLSTTLSTPLGLICVALLWTLHGQTPLAATASPKAATYSVGLSKVDITPAYPVRLNGFGGRRDESEGITQRIYAKAIAMSERSGGKDAGDPMVIVTVDNLGIRLSMVEEVSRRLREKTGLGRARLAVTFSHSHTTPKVNGASDTIFSSPIPAAHQERIDRYTSDLTDWIEEAALQALADRRPSHLSWSVGSVGFAKNRRTPGGPVDHDLPILIIRDASTDALRGIYVSYACHCVTLSDNKISGDWAGYAQAAIERDHPGTICLTSIGCGSDANPDSGVTGARADIAASQGEAICTEVARLLARPAKPLAGALHSQLNQIELPLADLPTREEMTETARNGGAAGYSAQWHLDKLDRGEELMTAIDYSIQSLTFGDDLAMLFLAGEVCVDYALRLKREFDRDRLWINAYANDFCSYIPSERLLTEGGYGGGAEMVYFGVPTTLKPGLEELIVDEIHRQVPEEFSAIADPKKTSGSRPLPPEQSRAAIEVPEGLKVELMASEPLVVDPVAIDFGPDGKLWVCEMHDYPEGLDGNYQAGGRIRYLEDSTGDGRFDRSILFAEGLPFPTEVKVWRKGVLVCAAPDVLYLEDTDGDGKADRRETILSGFATHNYQARVNSLRPGLDGWMYGAVGLFGGEIESTRGNTRVALNGKDFRFHPDRGTLEPATGNSQQGRARDDWGRWFGCTNGTLIKHYPLAHHDLRRNPHVAPPPLERDVLAGSGFTTLHPARANPQLFDLSGAAGGVTSACGIEIYRDNLLGEEYLGDAFTCEPVNLLVHRTDLQAPAGQIAATAAPPPPDREFLASTDRWFRPVQVRTGPDGALWIVDMYRFVIEHPRWIPDATLEKLDVRAGSTMGRIYRVHPEGTKPRTVPRLDRLDAVDLVNALDTPNGAVRDLVMQMTSWRNDPEAKGALVGLLEAENTTPVVRLQAMCTLETLGDLPLSSLAAALRDPHPDLRAHAARLCGPQLEAQPTLHEPFLALLHDPSPAVRLQMAASLGDWTGPRAGQTLAALLTSESNPDVKAIALSSVLPHLELVTSRMMDSDGDADLLSKLIAMAAATLPLERLSQFADEIVKQPSSHRLAADLLEALARRDIPETKSRIIFFALADPIRRARAAVRNETKAPQDIVPAIRLLGWNPAETQSDASLLLGLIRPDLPLTVHSAALERLQAMPPADNEVAARLFDLRSSAGPLLRTRILDTLLSRPAWTKLFLEELLENPQSASTIDPARRQTLLEHPDKSLAELAARAFHSARPSTRADRQKRIRAYSKTAESTGDAERGQGVFRQTCSACHRIDGIGIAIGPDLGTLSDQSTPALLTGILDPNRAVLDQYLQYVLTTRSGESLSGLIARETPTTVILKQLDGTTREILRTEIASLQSLERSLMPEGLETSISENEMGDLLAFLQAPRIPRKNFPANTPLVIKPNAEGILTLPAKHSEIFGREIVLEEQFENLGYWHSPDDRAVWTVELDRAASFDVSLHYACADGSAGGRFILEGGGDPIRGDVAGTGEWSNYRVVEIGSVSLPAGRSRLTLRSDGPLESPLFDLRALRLTP